MSTPNDPIDIEEAPAIIVTEGPAMPNPRETSFLNAWSVSFLAALLTLIGLCLYKPDPYWEVMKFVPDGLLVTFQITVISLCFVIPIGLFTGLGKLSRCKPINLLASTYVEIIRGIPLLMQLFYIYYALGSILRVSPTVAAVAALSICYGAYMGEVFRAGHTFRSERTE